MRHLTLSLILLTAATAAPTAALAQNSHCAALPITAQVEARGPDTVQNAQLTPRGFQCPRGFTTETVGPVTRCRQPGQIRLETREPRKSCHAGLQVAAPRSINIQNRPAPGCTTAPTITSIVALRARNIGWQDVTVTAPREANLTIEHLRTSGGRTPAAEDPIRQDCFAHECRLVRLTARPTTPERVTLTIATPENASSSTLPITFEATCPAR